MTCKSLYRIRVTSLYFEKMHFYLPSASDGYGQMMLQDIQLIARVAVSIVLEAAPFLLLGSLLSAAVDRYADTKHIARRIPKGPLGRMAVGLLGGMVMPICECGSVPLARRMLEKGVPPLTAITYMLAAPVIKRFALLRGNMVCCLADAIAMGVMVAADGGQEFQFLSIAI
jgi:uncharacterized membrane protein YraQ (UPF0718 family)